MVGAEEVQTYLHIPLPIPRGLIVENIVGGKMAAVVTSEDDGVELLEVAAVGRSRVQVKGHRVRGIVGISLP